MQRDSGLLSSLLKGTLTKGQDVGHGFSVVKIEERGGEVAHLGGPKGVEIEMFRSHKAPEGAEFLPSMVRKQGKLLWDYREEKGNGFCFLRECKGEFVIVSDARDGITNVMSISMALIPKVKVNLPGGNVMYAGGPKPEDLLDLKVAYSKAAKRRAILTDEEKKIIADREERARQAMEAEKEKVRLAQEAERKKREAILARHRVDVFDAKGKPHFCTPVTKQEENTLPQHFRAVEVNAIVDGKPQGEPLAVFTVGKDGQRTDLIENGLTWEDVKRIQREARRAEIIGRKRVPVYNTKTGKRLPCIPVTKTEKDTLPDHSLAVLVEAIVNGKPQGEPLAVFTIRKTGSKVREVERIEAEDLAWKPKETQGEMVNVQANGAAAEPMLCIGESDIKAFEAAGINSGYRAAVKTADGKSVFIYTFEDGKAKKAKGTFPFTIA